ACRRAAAATLAALLYAGLRPHRPGGTHRPAPVRGVRAGLSVLRGDPTLRATVGLAAVAIATSGFQTAALYSFVTARLGLPASFLGVLLSAQGAGSVAGGLVVGRILGRRGPLAVAGAGALLCAAGCLARCLPWWPATVAAGVVTGVGLPWTLVAALTAVQTRTPDALLGRVGAAANTALFGPLVLTIPLGSATVHLGARPAFAAAAAACLAATAVARRGARPGRASP
ncbi:MAG TPA: MFS transporter, partial [Pilimelia sp.]|nr:MFS transporter [Pilimelia sp.]